MILDDDLDPKTKRPKLRSLDMMSIPELKEYVAFLKEEISRVESDIQKKEKSKSAADSLFKTS